MTDTYVYDIVFPREKLSLLDTKNIDIQQFVKSLHPLIDITEEMHLSGIQSPGWIEQVSKNDDSAN